MKAKLSRYQSPQDVQFATLTREQRFTIDGGTSIFESLAVSPDERTLAAGARDGTIRLYRAASREEVQAVPKWWRLPEGESTR